MANTYTSLRYHLIFSTKNREPWLVPDIEQRIWAFIGGIARAHNMTALQVGGVEDHIHALVTAPLRLPPPRLPSFSKVILQNGFMRSSNHSEASDGKMVTADSR